MNIKESILLLTGGLFIFLTGCKTVDPPPYFFSPKPLEESERERLEWKREREDYVATHAELSKRQRGLILGGVVGEELTKEQVRLVAGGHPDKIEKDNLKYDADEMWFYRGVKWNDYFYFKDGVIIKIDHKR